MNPLKTSGWSHILSILNAAKPFLNEQMKSSVELLSKAEDLASSIKNVQTSSQGKLVAMEQTDSTSSSQNVNLPQMENMLKEVKKVCYPKEQATVNTMLNILHARSLYQSYQFYKKEHPLDDTNSQIDYLISQLNPQQQQTLQILRATMGSQ